MPKDLLSIGDLSAEDIRKIFSLTDRLKKTPASFKNALAGKTLALIFQKPSNRTRVSFEVGIYQLGGNSVYLGPGEINLGVRETIADVAKTLSRYADAIVLRTFEHNNVVEMAKEAGVPVINGLSDFSHPCQALADIYTVKEKLGSIKGRTLAYVGDGNNVCNSLLYACARAGLNMNVATPKGYEPDGAVFEGARVTAAACGIELNLYHDPHKAVAGADVVYTDVWASMGQEKEAQKRKKIFMAFQVNAALLAIAKKGAIIMHCLPAHRGEEITSDCLDSRNSVVFDQAENRMHVQKAILLTLLK